MPTTQAAPRLRTQHIGATRRAWGDTIIVLRLLNDRRQRLISGVFGVSRRFDANVVSLLAISAFAAGFRRAFTAPRQHVHKFRSSPTHTGDTMIGSAVTRETIDSIAGHPARDIPFAASLLAFAVVVHTFRPTIARLLRAAREAVRELIAEAHRLVIEIRRLGI